MRRALALLGALILGSVLTYIGVSLANPAPSRATADAPTAPYVSPLETVPTTTIASTGPPLAMVSTTTTTTTIDYSTGGNPTVPASALAACSAIGGSPRQGDFYWPPACMNVSYVGTDGGNYYVNLGLNASGVVPVPNVVIAANQTECTSGSYPLGPLVTTPGHWSAALGLCLP